jgi:hypothetical protein
MKIEGIIHNFQIKNYMLTIMRSIIIEFINITVNHLVVKNAKIY